MIPGNHYNFVKRDFYYVDQVSADLNFYRQMLTGDRVDNIPGIEGIGDVKAAKLLDEHGRDPDRVKEAVKDLYRRQYGDEWESAYQEVGVLLWMRRELTDAASLSEYIKDVTLL